MIPAGEKIQRRVDPTAPDFLDHLLIALREADLELFVKIANLVHLQFGKRSVEGKMKHQRFPSVEI